MGYAFRRRGLLVLLQRGSEGLINGSETALHDNWWDRIDESEDWQRGVYYALCASYALISFVALNLNVFWLSCHGSFYFYGKGWGLHPGVPSSV
ncbi:hypothetical protein CRG98_016229 [Punica granatum]|uniref:THH1/TOM1/TOM3 domain-containing protein n=1 Tax=Punica granatum TaxID=22663 RepID=A0A2I0K457_PUNGR|nr:hypothetical protein CRG98_016229 [Punica granatum]